MLRFKLATTVLLLTLLNLLIVKTVFAQVGSADGSGTILIPSLNTLFAPTINNPIFTGVASFPAGSAGAPSIFFTGSATTGLYQTSADRIAFSLSGNKVVELLTSAATNVLTVPDGSVTVPGISFISGGISTGLYRIGATSFGATANGVNVATFASTGITSHYIASVAVTAVANVGANSCGTSAATIAGSDNAGAITVGATGGTQCRITFTTTAPTRRHCIASNETTGNLARGIYVDTTHSDIIGTFAAADIVTYICLPR